MKKCLSFALVLILVWQTIGIQLAMNFQDVRVGAIAFFEARDASKNRTVYLPQIETALLSNESYQAHESLIMVGDVLLARNVEFLMRNKGGSYPFDGLDLATLGSNPAVVGNFEAAIPKFHKPTKINQLDFSVSTTALKYLHQAGFTHLSLANNHTLDFNEAGYKNTYAELSKLFEAFGREDSVDSNSTKYLKLENFTLALVGINGLITHDKLALKRILSTAASKSDFQIIYIHWGEEYALKHNQEQTSAAKTLVDLGADLIVGHHPHVIQGVDLIDGVPVFYSLGNYIFDQYFSKDVQEGLVLVLTVTDGLQLSLLPVSSKMALSQPNLMSLKSHSDLLSTISRKSHPDLANDIARGNIKIDLDLATSDKVAMMQDVELYVK